MRPIVPGTTRKEAGVRIGISLLGLAFILWGFVSMALGLVGEKGVAVITHIRREGGERNEAIRGRYTYCIAYSFFLPDGRRMDGSTKRIGDSVYLKADGKTTAPVRYFASLPSLNSLEKDARPNPGHAVIIGTGAFLVWVINSKKLGKRKK